MALPILGLAKVAGEIVDQLWTSDEEKDEARFKREALKAKLESAVLQEVHATNRAEATHRSIFVAGWRPYIGWTCGTALAYHFLAHPLIAWAVAIWAPHITPPPDIDVAALYPLLMGMLGLGAVRTYEKVKGAAK